ncbi:MAG: putative calmodulin 1b [Streblomastix strix]|uniref:Putative calmodulin 1b n=1 Tax=Streblomastix strix TaxID=222440 RepID=A0A5J4W4H4_9EUKA|nr:MAG: putative calmodulin 1b [Streblomastix strix]
MCANKLSEQEILELREAFSLFDRDGSGQIDESELKAVMNDCLGLKMTDKEVKDMISEIDRNKNGQIDFDEFLVLMASNWTGALDSEQDILDAFAAFDTDGSGSISVEEFRMFFQKLNWNLSAEEINEMINDIDSNHDGAIDYKEFADMLFKGEYQQTYSIKKSRSNLNENSRKVANPDQKQNEKNNGN